MSTLDYGVIGNCKSAALVSPRGSIDWCCLPEFDSASVFAHLLDEERGGRFAIEVGAEYEASQRYLEDTNILLTRFSNGRDAFDLYDFMPRYRADSGYYCAPPDLIRYLEPISGTPELSVHFEPRLAYAEHPTETRIEGAYIKSATADGSYESVYLYTDLDKEQVAGGHRIRIDSAHFFWLSYNQKLISCDLDTVRLELERTKVYWLNWVARGIRFSEYQEPIKRSALVLKLLAYHRSGAILAAVTTSLPETPGEERNWDYRFCWIRDASMIVSVLTALGHYNAARRFLDFVIRVIPYKDEKIQIMYGIRGEKELTEREIPWFRGFRDSRPVRVGNDAYRQKQHDIYGVLADVIWQYFQLFGHTLSNSEDLWTILRTLLHTVERTWRYPDKSIWEVRSGEQHFTFSKVLCWVAMDRGVRIAELLGKADYVEKWSAIREQIREDVLEHGWNEEIGAFTQHYATTEVDAANLLMEQYGFIDAHDPRYIATVERSYRELVRDGLMYRYRTEDDFGLPKSSFTVCTFWMIRSLHVIGREEDARAMFERVLGYANHLGLFSEDIDFETKELLGNFPQGYSHLALIDTAMTISGNEMTAEQKMLSLLGYPFR
jgi:GH15 family glucan-1,4-alpha-glucosidase